MAPSAPFLASPKCRLVMVGEALDPCFQAIDTPLQIPGAGRSLPREGVSPCRHLRMRARFPLFFR